MSFALDNLIEGLRVFVDRGETNVVFEPFVREVVSNHSEFDWVADRLKDQHSKDVLSWMIKYRFVSLLLRDRKAAMTLCPPSISPHRYQLLVEQAKNLPEADYEANYDMDVIENFLLDGYNLEGICEVSDGDVVLDFGGFNGNSAIALGRRTPGGNVHVFEPNPSMQDVLLRNVKKSGLSNIRLVRAGVDQRPGRLRFRRKGAASRIDPQGDIEVDIVSIDNWVSENELKKVDFLKFDIEGFEIPALKGARKTISYFRPKMAICVYHLQHDISQIPRLVDQFGGWYDFYLRHNAATAGEIVLYCAPKS